MTAVKKLSELDAITSLANSDLLGASQDQGGSVYISKKITFANIASSVVAVTPNLVTLTNDSMADSLHRHSELSASDGTPNPALSVDASGNVGIGTTGPVSLLHIEGAGSTSAPGTAFLTIKNTHGQSNDQFGINFTNTAFNGTARINSLLNDGGATSELHFYTGGATPTDRMVIKGVDGNVGIGTTAPTAVLHLKAGTATASTAPLKFTSGVNLTTAEAGATEYDGTSLYFTRAGTVRERIGTIITKTDTGDATGAEGVFQINTFDNTFKVYADGGWRAIATW